MLFNGHIFGMALTSNYSYISFDNTVNFALKKNITSSVYDCTVEDVEYIYNKLSIHIFNSKSRLSVL